MYANAVLTGAIITAFVLPFAASAPIQKVELETRIIKDFKPLHMRDIENRDDDTFYSGGGYKRDGNAFFSGDQKRDDDTFFSGGQKRDDDTFFSGGQKRDDDTFFSGGQK